MGQREVHSVTSQRQGRFTLRRGRGRRGSALRRGGRGAAALCIALGVGASPTLAGASTPALSPALRAQAHDLYAPVKSYEQSTSPAQRARSGSAARHVGKMIDACDAPYRDRIDVTRTKQAAKLSTLWNNATLLQTYQADVTPVAAELTKLAAAWAALSLRNRAMNEFVHGVAAEFQATLAAPPFDSCGFVQGIAAHHFSYAWAKRSSYGCRRRDGGRRSVRRAIVRTCSGDTSIPTLAGKSRPTPVRICSRNANSSCFRTSRANLDSWRRALTAARLPTSAHPSGSPLVSPRCGQRCGWGRTSPCDGDRDQGDGGRGAGRTGGDRDDRRRDRLDAGRHLDRQSHLVRHHARIWQTPS